MTRTLTKSFAAVAIACVISFGTAVAQETNFTVTSDIPYGPLERQKLDVYFPSEASDRGEILIFFYGGSFHIGDKDSLKIIGRSFASEGTVFVAPNFRNYPDAVFPIFVEDAAQAVNHVLKTLVNDEHSRPVFLGGWSSGAYIAAMVGINEDYLQEFGIPKGTIAGIIGIAGSYQGGLCGGIRCEEVFPEAEHTNWSVADFLDKGDPPLLLFAAGKEHIPSARDPSYMIEQARENEVEATLIVVSEAYHRSMLQDMWEPNGVLRSAIADFLEKEQPGSP